MNGLAFLDVSLRCVFNSILLAVHAWSGVRSTLWSSEHFLLRLRSEWDDEARADMQRDQ